MFEQVTETLGTALGKVFGSQNERTLRRLWVIVREQITPRVGAMQALPDDALRGKTAEFRSRLSRGASLDDILPEAFSVVREASRRTIGLVHFDTQMIGGVVLHRGMIAEMATGEGKTLVATTPVYLNALAGRGVHVVTVNDYLARRDTQWMGPIYEFLGLSIGCIQHEQAFLYDRSCRDAPDEKLRHLRDMPTDAEWDRIGRDLAPQTVMRRLAYQADITYGTNNEFGFDYLRDNMKVRAGDRVQRGHAYAVVDEVDNILIDEARTPLIISGPAEESTEKYAVADRVARRLVRGEESTDDNGNKRISNDFAVKEKEHAVVLSEDGIQKAEQLVGVDTFYSGDNMEWPHHIEQALRAHHLYRRDRDYVVMNGEVVIVDDHTHRIMPGRRWSDGLHQAVETKEGLRVKEETQTYATITLQNYFKMYEKLAGMTGTAATEAMEFEKIYKLAVVVIPTNRELRRITHPDIVFSTEAEKFDAAEAEIVRLHRTGRPLLVGTASIEKSEHLSDRLRKRGVRHEVLNAKFHEREAHIVSLAGQFGAVTISTNMAGRGTDILLGKFSGAETDVPRICEWLQHAHGIRIDPAEVPAGDAAALVKFFTERLDAFFATRSGQRLSRDRGDDEEGASPEEIRQAIATYLREGVAALGGLHVIGTERHEARRIDNQLRGRAGRQGDPGSSQVFMSLDDDLMRKFAPPWAIKWIKEKMQPGEAIESGMVTKSIARAQRNVEAHNFEIRKNLLEYDQVMNEQRKIIYGLRQRIMEDREIRETVLQMAEDAVLDVVDAHAPPRVPESEWNLEGLSVWCRQHLNVEIPASDLRARESQTLADRLLERVRDAFGRRERELGEAALRGVSRWVLLDRIDDKWKEHLYNMDQIRTGISLRSYAQMDPKVEYKREARELFDGMMATIREEVTELVMKVRPVPVPASAPVPVPMPFPAGAPPMAAAGPRPVPTAAGLEQLMARLGRRWKGTEMEHRSVSSLAGAEGAGAVRPAAPPVPESAPAAGASAGGPPGAARPRPMMPAGPKVGRNDPCPCGSGKKYKKCHGQGA